MIKFKDISEANRILEGIVKNTFLKKSKTFSEMTNSNIYLKMENLQLTGSFKIRGAYNKIYHLSEKEKKKMSYIIIEWVAELLILFENGE